MSVIQCPSPNFGPRKNGCTPSLIVLHYTAMPIAQEALDRLCAPEYEVSAHYLVHRDGRLFQMVPEDMRAWHAGAGTWRGLDDINSRSIGVEIDNDGQSPFSEAQLSCLETLLPQIMQRWSIPPEAIIGHSDMAPSRKADPGRKFPWTRLARQDLAITAPQIHGQLDQNASEAEFLRQAVKFGYPTDAPCHATLDAMRQRFRPWASGPLDAHDLAIITDLAMRFPVDHTAPFA